MMTTALLVCLMLGVACGQGTCPGILQCLCLPSGSTLCNDKRLKTVPDLPDSVKTKTTTLRLRDNFITDASLHRDAWPLLLIYDLTGNKVLDCASLTLTRRWTTVIAPQCPQQTTTTTSVPTTEEIDDDAEEDGIFPVTMDNETWTSADPERPSQTRPTTLPSTTTSTVTVLAIMFALTLCMLIALLIVVCLCIRTVRQYIRQLYRRCLTCFRRREEENSHAPPSNIELTSVRTLPPTVDTVRPVYSIDSDSSLYEIPTNLPPPTELVIPPTPPGLTHLGRVRASCRPRQKEE